MKSVKHIDEYGIERWYENGSVNRENGPAISSISRKDGGILIIYSDGSEEWFIMGRYHREDGPAVIYKDGTREYYLNGKFISFEAWLDQTTDEGRLSFLFSGGNEKR